MEENDHKRSPKVGKDLVKESKNVVEEESGSDVQTNGMMCCGISLSFSKRTTIIFFMYF